MIPVCIIIFTLERISVPVIVDTSIALDETGEPLSPK